MVTSTVVSQEILHGLLDVERTVLPVGCMYHLSLCSPGYETACGSLPEIDFDLGQLEHW
jgi:hypothetical protein